jgi:hypothetical protein
VTRLPTHDAVRQYVRDRGMVPTITPGVYRRRCLWCSSELHAFGSPVFHSERIEGPSRDESGRWDDPVRVWRESQ